MKLIECKGEVQFFEDEQGKLFQRIDDCCIFTVKDGEIAYEGIDEVNGLKINYNLNGKYGFCVQEGNLILEDGFWSLDDAVNFALLK